MGWSDPPEAANLFNPAFFGEVARRVSESYTEECESNMPIILAFLATPLVVYRDTRQTLNPRKYSYLHTWSIANPHVRIGLARRVDELKPYIRLGLAFAIRHRSIVIDEAGAIRVLPRTLSKKRLPKIDSSDYFKGAKTLGRWLARTDRLADIFVMLGMRP